MPQICLTFFELSCYIISQFNGKEISQILKDLFSLSKQRKRSKYTVTELDCRCFFCRVVEYPTILSENSARIVLLCQMSSFVTVQNFLFMSVCVEVCVLATEKLEQRIESFIYFLQLPCKVRRKGLFVGVRSISWRFEKND